MTKYDYKITCTNSVLDINGCSDRIDFSVLSKGNWATIDCSNIGKRILLNMLQVVSIEERIYEE